MRFIRLVPLFLFLSDSCIEPYDFEEHLYTPQLVVNGIITDQPGPYFVYLNVSSPASTDLDIETPVRGADVTIYDDEGNQELLSETKPGQYQTSASGFRGTVGTSYRIEIETDGKRYVSDDQKMLPAGAISNLFAEYEENAINYNDISKPQDVVRVVFDSKGVNGFPNLFRWRWSGIYEVRTFPELVTKIVDDAVVPAPLPCSGYVYDGLGLKAVDICTCCQCWVDEFGTNAHVSKNQFVTNDTFKNILAASLPVTSDRFFFKYHVTLQQLSISEEVYNFWKLIEAQQRGAGDLFQPNNIRIKGNIKNENDPGDEALGVFAVSAVAEKSIFISSSLIKKPMSIDTIKANCQFQYPGSTNIKPPFW